MKYLDFNKLIYNQSDSKKFFTVDNEEKDIMKDTYLQVLKNYKKRGFPWVVQYLLKITEEKRDLFINNMRDYNYVDFCNFSDRISPELRNIGIENGESSLCLERSSTLCAALLIIGIPAQIVIGKSQYVITKNFDFHAWVEINKIPVTDPILVKKQWKEISRVPNFCFN